MTTETANPATQTDASTAFLRAARAGHLDRILSLLSQDVDINVSNANGLNAMHLASKDGHEEVVASLLQRGAHIDAATKKGNTALHIAALAGQEAVVKLLVQSGAHVNIQSQNGFTPLYMAAQENHDEVVKFLLANGANQSLSTEDGFTPLAVAMQQGHEKVVAVLLEADTGRIRLPALHIAAKKDDCKAAALLLDNDHNPDVTSKSGFTPLHIAAHYGNEAVAKLLLTKDANVNLAAKHNICPLHVAAKWGKANMVALLAENNALVDAKTRDGLTPLHCAARSGHEHVVDMLLERGAPISGKSKNGLAPLHMAAQGDHSDAARILLYHRAPVDDLTVDYLTALHVAAHCGHVKVAKLLLDRNADANARALNGFTPLHIACKKNRIKVVELLLKYGASIKATTESGLTPLHVAAFMGCMNIVIYLLQHEASPDAATVRGETPLHLAARANQTDIIRILLRNGACVDARAREEQTALHIASRLGNVDIVLLLLQHGAQLDALTADNYNALHIAAKQHNHEVAQVLLEHGAPPEGVTKKGFTPLHLAAKYGNLRVATLLLQNHAADLNAKGKNGVTPLHVAAQYRNHAVAQLLLEKGADPKAVAKNGHTPLHIAARKNQMETAALLMEKGAEVDVESKAGCTPLHLAAHQGHAEMCSYLMEQGADPSRSARSGLTGLHLAAQEDHVPVAKLLVNNGAKVDVCTKGSYTPLHVASHFGQTNMVKFLLESGANVQANTCHNYTALHHAAQQGHINIVNILLEHKADNNATTLLGQTPMDIANRLGYVTVVETLKGAAPPAKKKKDKDKEEDGDKDADKPDGVGISEQAKYKAVCPESMYETFMSDSEEEGGEDTHLTDQPYRYLTVDDMKSLGDDSLPIDVTRDERAESTIGMKNIMDVSQGSTTSGPPYVIDELTTAKTVNHLYNAEVMKEGYCYNVDTTQPKRKLQWKNFLVSFLVDARGGALRGCRGGGVRVIVPPLSAQQPTRITCRYVRAQRVSHMPPLMEGEALASRVLELGPVSAKFIGPIILEVPHFASLRGKEREIVILRSDNGSTWREHALEAADCTVQDILSDTLEIEDPPEEAGSTPARVTRILTHDFPQYFAVISRIRQEVHAIGPEGGMVSSSVVPQVQAVFPSGALTKKIKVGLQAQTIEAELTAKLLGRGVAVSPVVTVEPRRRKFHKAITLSMPAPRPHSQGMINQYTSSAPTLRLLCSISGGTNRAHWEDVTESTPLTFVNDCVSFTTTVSARYWLMDCRNVSEATKMATELYREAIHVPFMARFVVFAKRTEHLQAQLRVFCVTDDREDKTLERMERFSQVAKSKDVEVHEGKPVYLEFGGNFSPVAQAGEQPRLDFRAFRESRLRLGAMVRGAHADAVARCLFMREPRRAKGEPAQPPICTLNIVLPEEVVPMDLLLPPFQGKMDTEGVTEEEVQQLQAFQEKEAITQLRLTDARITSMCNLLGMDWVPLAYELGVSHATVASVRERGTNGAQQAALMLRLWREQGGAKAHDNCLELALCRIGREDVLLPQSTAEAERRIQRNIYQERQSSEEIISYKSPEPELMEKERMVEAIMEQEDINKALDSDGLERLERELFSPKDEGEGDEAKYSPEEKSYVEDGEASDREPSLTPSEESEEEEGIKKSVAERKIQITRKLSSSKIPASKQKRELKEEISEIKKQINPEVKKFHIQQTSISSQPSTESMMSKQDSFGKLSKKSSEDEEAKKLPTPQASPDPAESPKEKVLPKSSGPRHMQKHVRNESMIRFSSGDFSDVKVTQKKPEEKITETKVIEETIIKGSSPAFKTEVKTETITKVEGTTRTTVTSEEIFTVEGRDVAEMPLRQKICSFESKMQTEKSKADTDRFESRIKLTEEALKKHTEGHGTSAEYTEHFIKDQMRTTQENTMKTFQDNLRYEVENGTVPVDPGSPDLVSDFASDLMKAEETFMASADHSSDKYTDNYFKGPKTFAKAVRTDSTIVQFSSEDDSECLKKSTDSETETESQITTVKQQVGLLEEHMGTAPRLEQLVKPGGKIPAEAVKSPKLTINIEQQLLEDPEELIEEAAMDKKEEMKAFLAKEIMSVEAEAVRVLKERLGVDSVEDSLQISSDEDAQVQRTDDESEIKEQLSDEVAEPPKMEAKSAAVDNRLDSHTFSDSISSEHSRMGLYSSSPQTGPLATADRTDSLADSVSYVSHSESKITSKESRPTRSDSLDEASQFSDMEETQIGVASAILGGAVTLAGAAAAPAVGSCIRTDTMRFLEQEFVFSSTELDDRFKKKEKSPEEPVISAKARQFIETVPEDEVSVQDCFFSKRIYSDSIEEAEQYGEMDSRRQSEADSVKSDKSDRSSDQKMGRNEESMKERIEKLGSSKEEPDEVQFEFVKVKSKDSKDEDSEHDTVFQESSEIAQDALMKKTVTKRHSRNESVSITKFSSLEMKDELVKFAAPSVPEVPQRATEFQMFVTEAADDERVSSFDKEDLSDRISSEDSREIEISEKKWSDGVSDKISSEDGVTDKVSSDSGAQIEESERKASSDTLHRSIDIKSPDLILDDDKSPDDQVKIQPEFGMLDRIESRFSGFRDSTGDAASSLSSKLDDTLKGLKRASLSSTGEELAARAGKRASDAPSLTDSRDYTFEESEDNFPSDGKHEVETRARAILEPIYDKALKAVRGDSLDDVEPFCLDQDSPRLPGIEETHQAGDRSEADAAAAMEAQQDSGDSGREYSVHSSPDEVEEKICTESESELDQAKVLEIIEPTSEGDAGFAPSFDTSKLKQDSLDDADDFFPEKEMDDLDDHITTHKTTSYSTKSEFGTSSFTTTSSTVQTSTTNIKKTVTETSQHVVESFKDGADALSENISSLESKLDEGIIKDEEEEESDHEHYISEPLSEVGVAVAASIGINLKACELKNAERESSRKSSMSSKHEFSVSEQISGAGVALAASIGVKDLELEPKKAEISHLVSQDSTVSELISDASATLAHTVGIELDPKEVRGKISRECSRESLVEIISDAASTLAATAGIDFKPELIEVHDKSEGSQNSKHVSELVSDASSALAASVGIDFKPEEEASLQEDDEELSIGENTRGITESLSMTGAALAGSIGIALPQIQRSPSKDSVITHEDISEKVSETGSTAIDVALKYGEEHFVKQLSGEVEKLDTIEVDTIEEKVLEAAGETAKEAKGKKEVGGSPDLTPEDTEKLVSEMKDLNRLDRRCSDLLEGISQPGGSQIRIDTSHVTHELSLKFSKTPPPSPVDLIQRDKTSAASGLTGQQHKGPEAPAEPAGKLSPRDARLPKDSLLTDGDTLQPDCLAEITKSLSKTSSPKSPTRHHVDNIAFVNVEALTIHPDSKETTALATVTSTGDPETMKTLHSQMEKDLEDARKSFKEETRKKFEDMKRDFEDNAIAKFKQMKEEFAGKDFEKKSPDGTVAIEGATSITITKKESVTHKISGQESYTEKKIITSSEDAVVAASIETKRQISGKEYELKEEESTSQMGDVTHSEKSSLERDQQASAERNDSEKKQAEKSGDDALVVKTQREFSEQGLYSGRQSKSEEKMTSIKDEVSKKSEVSYSERDLSHEQWGKEYFAERTELEPTEEVESEFTQDKEVYMESAVKVVEKDEKMTTEEVTQEGQVVSATTGYSKEESIVESKEHDDMSSDISHDISFKSEVAGKRDSFDEKSEMSPKSRSKSLKREEVFDVDFIKEIKVSTSQREKSFSQGGSLDTQSESDMTGESDFIAQASQDLLPEDKVDKTKGNESEKKPSPSRKPEERFQEHVWEVSVQQQESADEVASDLGQHSKSARDETKSWDIDFTSQSESKSSLAGIMTISSDKDVKIKLNGLSLANSEETQDGEQQEEYESLKDSMLRSGESVETEYMIKSIDSQDTDTLQKSMDSVSAETMQHSEKEDFSIEAESFVADLQKKGEHKLVKEKSLEDICSSGYDTDLSSAEFLASKLEHERADSRPQPLVELSDLEKTIDECKQSLEAAHGEIINEKHDGTIKYKQSPSEFEFKLISPDRPEVIQEEQPEVVVRYELEKSEKKPTEQYASASSEASEEKQEAKKEHVKIGDSLIKNNETIEIKMTDKDIQISLKESEPSSKHDFSFMSSDEENRTALEKDLQDTHHELSEMSTGLESGPISLVDTEPEMVTDKEESPKSSPEVKLRPIQKHVKAAHMTIADRRSGSDLEGWSSSGESHYQSFEHTDSPHSRPLSSDVENILTGTAEFHSALTTQEISSRSQRTSKEYYTAVSTLSSRDSMRSLDSESSGHVASIDISDASETLVPSATELKEEMTESGAYSEPFDTDVKKAAIDEEVESPIKEKLSLTSGLDATSQPGFSDHSEEGSLDDEVNEVTGGSTEVICKMKRSHEMSFQPKELLPEKFPSESLSESVDMELETGIPESDSQVFSMSKIETGPCTVIKHMRESKEVKGKSSIDTSKSYEISEKTVEYHTSSVVYKTPEKKKPKPVEVETIIERKTITVKTEAIPHVVTTFVDEKRQVDFDSLEGEIIPRGSEEYQEIISTHVIKTQSATSVSSTSSVDRKPLESYPIDSKQSSSSSLKIQEDFLSTPQTPISLPSQSSESTDNGREYVLDDMYEISEDPELFHSERALTDSKSEISVTAEERTLYEAQREPDSPTSDEFEMVDRPSEIDDFVVIEEVAREASEFDAEGKSLSIAKVTYTKKHDEEIEDYLSQTAKKASETEYSTSGSLSEEEMVHYEQEQRRMKAAENAEIEAGKKWIQMQFEGDLAAARYDYERGPLEDIKEEEMTDFDASRIGSLTSQKESVGSYGSLKNSYGSLSESEMVLRRRYMMRPGEQDDVSVSSLQEFETLEQALSMETYQHSSSSQDSLNGSLSRRYQLSKNGQGDDISISSLKEFEGLESACLEALKIEINAKQKEALLLSQDGRLSSQGFLDMEKRSYSHGSSESSPPQKGGSPGQKSGSPSQKSGSPSQKSNSPSLKSGSPGQKFGSPSQKALTESLAIRKLIDQQMAEGGDDIKVGTTVTDGGVTITYVTAQKKVYDNRGAFYVPVENKECIEPTCTKKSSYECKSGSGDDAEQYTAVCITTQEHSLPDEKTLEELGSSFTEADANMMGVITTTKVIQQRYVDGKKVSETITTTTGKGMDIPGAVVQDDSGEFGSGKFQGIDVGSGKSADFGSEFSSSITSQQSDTESLVTMMEQQIGSEMGSMETITVAKRVSSGKQLDLELGSRESSESGLRDVSPMSGKSGFASVTSKQFTDPASGSWSGLDEDMSSSGSFSRVRLQQISMSSDDRAKEEDLMLGSTDSLEQTSSNATRATYNYDVDTPMTGSLTSAGSNTMVSSLETLDPITTMYERGERALGLSTEDCFTMDHSGSDHTEYEVQEPDDDTDKQEHGRVPQAKERTARADEPSPATFFIGDTPIVRGTGDKTDSTSSSESPPIPAQRKSLTGLSAKPLVSLDLSKLGELEDKDDEENV